MMGQSKKMGRTGFTYSLFDFDLGENRKTHCVSNLVHRQNRNQELKALDMCQRNPLDWVSKY